MDTSLDRNGEAGTSRSARSNRGRVIAALSWIGALWICYVFITSLFYKFSDSPDTVHIFSTIGTWLGGFLGAGFGVLFTDVGAYAVGSFELLASLVLLSPAAFWLLDRARTDGPRGRGRRAGLHALGGALAAMVMSGAVFFHLASPLGIVVQHDGMPDGGNLFFKAVSILLIGIVMLIVNRRSVRAHR